MLINNIGSIPQNSPPFGQKMAGKPWICGGTSLEKFRFTGNDGYGWICLGTLSSKIVELARKFVRDGQKMAKTAVATRAHTLPVANVAHRPVMKFQC